MIHGASAGDATMPITAGDPLTAYRIRREPFYRPVSEEIALFEAAHVHRLPVVLKGPAGCGKTRFVEYMAWRLGRPLVTVACHQDLAAGDFVGRWLPDRDGMRWQDGPVTLAARFGGICCLDRLAEARADVTAVIDPLTDSRRMLPLSQHDEPLHAHPDFQLIVSCNRSPLGHPMKTSTRHRFCAVHFGYATPEDEAAIVAHESGLDLAGASAIVSFGMRTRRLRGHGLDEGASTRMLVHAAILVAQGLTIVAACRMAMVDALSDDPAVHAALQSALDAAF